MALILPDDMPGNRPKPVAAYVRMTP